MKPIFFNDAIKGAAKVLNEIEFPAGIKPLVIRDIHGRIRVAIDANSDEHQNLRTEIISKLGAIDTYLAADSGVIFKDELFNSNDIFNDPAILEVFIPVDGQTLKIQLLDRQITGQDWSSIEPETTTNIPRLVFFSLKGGVGRSTALTMLAYRLAQEGKNVLLIDLDLESPGLSGLLLPPDKMAEFGIIDWLLEDANGQGDAVLSRMISVSPLAETTTGQIRIAASMGMDESFYLDKLSRVYADVSSGGKSLRFSERIAKLINSLEEQEKPDVILIDSRAGLHDLGALSIVVLATHAFLFATDTAQTWQGYGHLFSHWRMRPKIAKKVREKLWIVDALFPETNQATRAAQFLDRSYKLFSENLYEEIAPGQNEENTFSFDLKDESAPHSPLRIKWNNRFQEFDPLLLSRKILTKSDIDSSFGEFLEAAFHLATKENE
ncbi:ParA family protein [Rariglobus hedericola]|uniref:MinD/ParA family protein n=1 Tax=Rariglobus hedericola TaxID=2597822 RepID=A0A556QN60_9BACT|nr:AAA family ATPase [Rariglobus hedericola]TSJ78081.1 MinD/ParA family protein [Rariglobus hedericola]